MDELPRKIKQIAQKWKHFSHCTIIILVRYCELFQKGKKHIIIFYTRGKIAFICLLFVHRICIEHHMIIIPTGTVCRVMHRQSYMKELFLLKKYLQRDVEKVQLYLFEHTHVKHARKVYSCHEQIGAKLQLQRHIPHSQISPQWITMHSFPSVVLSRLNFLFTHEWFMNGIPIAGGIFPVSFSLNSLTIIST